jgi:hypothetical protein
MGNESSYPRVYADFHNADGQGRLRLNCVGTIEDLSRLKVQLRDGLILTLVTDDADPAGRPGELQADGRVEFSTEEQCWVAAIDWDHIQSVPVMDKDGTHVNSNRA